MGVHEVVTFDDATVGVYEPDAGDWPMWEMAVEDADADAAVVYRRIAELTGPEPVFTGTEAEAAVWVKMYGREPLFTGNRAEADDWIADQEAAAESPWLWIALVGGGAFLVVAAIRPLSSRRTGA